MTPIDDRNELTRRDLLKAGAAAATFAVCAGCATVREADVITGAVDGVVRLDAASAAKLTKPGSGLAVQVAGMREKILVMRKADGALAAVGMKCTHRGCDVDYQLDVDRLVCPCHGSEFNTDGGNWKGPATTPLRRFVVREDAGGVVLKTG